MYDLPWLSLYSVLIYRHSSIENKRSRVVWYTYRFCGFLHVMLFVYVALPTLNYPVE